jgi:hypothetical protein
MVAEDVIFYFDLSTKDIVVSKKAIVKQVNKYIKDREKDAPVSNYGVVAFNQGEDNPRFQETMAKDETELETFFRDNLKFATKVHPIEQGLMLASTYLVETFRVSSDRVLRLVVISDGPTEGSTAALFGALMDLVDSIKYIPVFIDIIRIGDQRIYPDDIRLKTITDETCGLLRYASSEDAFRKVMHEIFSTRHCREPGPIPEDKRGFFEALCWPLVPAAQASGNCTVCGQDLTGTGEEAVECSRCAAGYHVACIEKHVSENIVMFPGITRCGLCQGLVRLPSRSETEPKQPPAEPGEMHLPVPGLNPEVAPANEGELAENQVSDSPKGLRSIKGAIPDMVPLHEIKPAEPAYHVQPEPPEESNDVRVVYIMDAPEDDDPKIIEATKPTAKKSSEQ